MSYNGAPLKMHWTYPNIHHMCIGCESLMNFEKIEEIPRLKLAVVCINMACEFYGQWFEVLPTLLKPYVEAESVSKIKLVTQ